MRPVINATGIQRDIIVIGASAGGVQPLITLLELLPGDLQATLAIVLHRSRFHEGRLPWVLGRHTPLRVMEPADGTPVRPRFVYVAPRDQHLVFDDGLVRLHGGPPEHRTRPAVDPLFRSAAARYGHRVVGVLLSGNGGDGVSGLIAIKKAGGLSLVQTPVEARFESMPARALAEDDVDAALGIEDLAWALAALARGEPIDAPRPIVLP
jgi:two-component system chemotaxis response regulator CheB